MKLVLFASCSLLTAVVLVACGGSPTTPAIDTRTDASDGSVPMDSGDGSATVVMSHFVQPTGDVVVSSQPVPLQVVVDAVVDRIDIVVDGVVVANTEAPYLWNLVTASLSPGQHIVVPRAVVGTATYDGTSFTLTVDRSPPELVSLQFATNAAPVPGSRTAIVATFDEELAPAPPASVTWSVQYTELSGPVGVYGVASRAGTTLVFTPSAAWAEAKGVFASLTGSVSDAAGNPATLGSQLAVATHSFWTAPTSLGSLDRNATVRGNGDFLFATFVPAFGSTTLGSIGVLGEVDGVPLVAPTLDAEYANVRHVSGGLDAHGAAYVLFEQYAPMSGVRELVVARRDPATAMWTKQTLVPSADERAVAAPSILVAANGHAFVRFTTQESAEGLPVTVTTTYHRAPSDSAFTTTSELDSIPLDATTAFPSATGRACSLVHGRGPTLHSIWCRGGGIAPREVAIDDASELRVSPAINERGDGVFIVGESVFLFDGSTETMSERTTIPGGSVWATCSISPLGHVSILYWDVDFSIGSVVLRFVRRAPSEPFGPPEVMSAMPEIGPGPLGPSATDAAGHFFYADSSHVLHDATPEGAWTPKYQYGFASEPRVLAGAANQAFLFAGPPETRGVRRFIPIAP